MRLDQNRGHGAALLTQSRRSASATAQAEGDYLGAVRSRDPGCAPRRGARSSTTRSAGCTQPVQRPIVRRAACCPPIEIRRAMLPQHRCGVYRGAHIAKQPSSHPTEHSSGSRGGCWRRAARDPPGRALGRRRPAAGLPPSAEQIPSDRARRSDLNRQALWRETPSSPWNRRRRGGKYEVCG